MNRQDFIFEELQENSTEESSEETDMFEEDTMPEDPLEPTLRGQTLDSQAKLMILNVHKYFHKFRIIRTKETGEDMNVNKVVAQATGVSESAVKKLVSDYRNQGIERAIRPPVKSKTRKRKSDIVIKVEEESQK